jgi:hypothetical protein
MHLRDDCSHVISEIRPKGSACSQSKIQENRRVTAAIKDRLHLRVGNMVFELLCYLWLMTVDFGNFGQHVFFGYMSNIFLRIISNILR